MDGWVILNGTAAIAGVIPVSPKPLGAKLNTAQPPDPPVPVGIE